MNLWHWIKNCGMRTKFILPISVILVASIIVISGYLIERQADGFRRELETNGLTMVKIMAMQAESGVLFESKYELDELLLKFSVFDNVKNANIYNADGQVLTQLGNWQDIGVTILREIPREEDSDHAGYHDYYVKDGSGEEFIELHYPVITRVETLDRENLGMTSGLTQGMGGGNTFEKDKIGSVRLILSLEQVNLAISQAEKAAIILTLVVAVFTILLLTFFVGVVTKPIKEMVVITDLVARGDLTQQVDIQQHDEVGQLAQTFNKMIESLQQSRDEIEEYNRTLEQKIIQRTLELDAAQTQLVQSEKMSAIGQLAAGVAHELNNPLGGILGYSQFALEKMKKSHMDGCGSEEMSKYIRYLGDIEVQARRCKAIVQNLLRFSRSSRTTEFEKVDINAIITDTITFIEHQLHMNQITLEVDLDSRSPDIEANSGQLQQVFTNLIINSMHASPPETTIEVKSRYSPALGEFEGAVELSFTDQGTGIEQENLKRIFEPFYTTKEVGKGTGLGLSVSYGIIKAHGGEIRVDSIVDKGTTFTIILPLQKPGDTTDTPEKQFDKGTSQRSG